MTMKKLGIVIAGVVALVLSQLNCGGAAENAPKNGKVDVFKYWPWEPGLVWTGTEIKNGFWSRTFIVKALGPSDGVPIRVLWPGNWMDYYTGTEKGMERSKDVNTETGNYGIYTPPAVQYPRYTRIGEIYRRTAIRSDYSKDGKLLISAPEEMSYIAMGFEDVYTQAGVFKDCLMQIRDYKSVQNGVEHRKIATSWNAENVGMVRGCLTEFRGGKMIENFCAEASGKK